MDYKINKQDFSHTVTVPPRYGDLLKASVAQWLDENCPDWSYNGKTTFVNDDDTLRDVLFFTFNDDTDFMAFKLRWL